MKWNPRSFARGPTRNFHLRRHALELLKSGNKVGVVAREIGVSCQTIFNWRKRYAETGEVAPRKAKGQPPHLKEEHRQRIRAHLAQFPKTTIPQLCALVHHVVSLGAMGDFLRSAHLRKADRLKRK